MGIFLKPMSKSVKKGLCAIVLASGLLGMSGCSLWPSCCSKKYKAEKSCCASKGMGKKCKKKKSESKAQCKLKKKAKTSERAE